MYCDSVGSLLNPGITTYTPQVPVLDLTGEHIKTMEDIKAAFHALNLCSQEEEELKSDGRKEGRAKQSK